MNLQYRVDLLIRLGEYMLSGDEQWETAKSRASYANGWFSPEFVEQAAKNIAHSFLSKEALSSFIKKYDLKEINPSPKSVGIVMAGNIPLVGFHDFLCVFISGNKAIMKASSKDEELIKNLVNKLIHWEPVLAENLQFSPMLKNCDAYIATGSNNSSRYFEYYFSKYPHIIRKNRSSVAVLKGDETKAELELLSDDVYQYFGLGCRNVTKLLVPKGYDFVPLLDAFNKYSWLGQHHKYKNNYDYNLAIFLLNKQYYMTNGSILLIEDPAIFSPISQLNYEFYDDPQEILPKIGDPESVQCVVGRNFVPFGSSQSPVLTDFADGVDTLEFLKNL